MFSTTCREFQKSNKDEGQYVDYKSLLLIKAALQALLGGSLGLLCTSHKKRQTKKPLIFCNSNL